MKRNALIVFACTATLCGSALLLGQNPVYVWDQPGVWRTTTYVSNSPGTPIGRPKASAAELAALRTALNEIERVVHATPMLTAPRGFDVHAWQRLDRGCPDNPVLCRQAPLAGWIGFDFEQYTVLDGKVMVMRMNGGAEEVEVAFNDPEATYVGHHAGNGGLTDLSGNLIVGPLIEVERVGNVAISDTGVVILGRNPRPFFVPVTREDYVRALMAQETSREQHVRESMAQGGTPLPTPWPGEHMVSEGLRDELTALSPEERRSPAYTGRDYSASNFAGLVPASHEGATPLFIFNPGYFDPALPRTAIQLITVRFAGKRDMNLETIRMRLNDRPDILERSPITPERLAFITASGLSVDAYRVFELTRLLNYSALAALLAAPAPPAR